MKSALVFFAGIVVGALTIWLACSKSYVLLPSGTTLVEVNRFDGSAREVYYSYEEANRLRREEDQRVEKEQEAWEKANTPVVPPNPEPNPTDKKKKPAPISPEELAQVRFIAKLGNHYNSPELVYSFYNGTDKTLVQATVRVEGTRKDSSIPLARNVEIRLNLKPSTDADGSTRIEHGDFLPSMVDGLKFTLTEVLSQ